MIETRTIYVWPNYDWCEVDTLMEMLVYHSDDYMQVEMLTTDSDESVDDFLMRTKPQG